MWLLGAVVSLTLGFFSEPRTTGLHNITNPDTLEPFHVLFLGFALLCLAECFRKLGNAGMAWHETILHLQHTFNPLHVYCYLVKKGWGKSVSFTICKGYEKLFYRWASRLTLILDVQVKHSK
jgi:hypothetical protein